ncbi:hypothetical protein KC351_g119 [Hortaea werneckii]|nr:hypothetical protein KC351_g119 [Hortaea werneckii]
MKRNVFFDVPVSDSLSHTISCPTSCLSIISPGLSIAVPPVDSSSSSTSSLSTEEWTAFGSFSGSNAISVDSANGAASDCLSSSSARSRLCIEFSVPPVGSTRSLGSMDLDSSCSTGKLASYLKSSSFWLDAEASSVRIECIPSCSSDISSPTGVSPANEVFSALDASEDVLVATIPAVLPPTKELDISSSLNGIGSIGCLILLASIEDTGIDCTSSFWEAKSSSLFGIIEGRTASGRMSKLDPLLSSSVPEIVLRVISPCGWPCGGYMINLTPDNIRIAARTKAMTCFPSRSNKMR